MSYTVLARRYRSQDFDEVVGQEPIARTLRRAIETDRIAHAYLFVGTRGVGKTSMARIFAKALNAAPNLSQRDEIAAAIMQGNDIDVIEIDGASNNTVEQARDLIANSIYRPTRCPYKIYIIDEVHMLSNAAFNALLKTMEEPPAHVKFILCTTEAHKVPATIQSRCQRFDFRSIPAARIADHLRYVLKKEKMTAEEAVIFEIARQGHGSMRDALSLLDRLAAAAGNQPLDSTLLREMLGIPDQSLIAALVDAIADGSPSAVLAGADELIGRGLSLDQVCETLIDHFRNLLIARTCGSDSALLERGEDERRSLAAQAARFTAESLIFMTLLLENSQRNLKNSATPRALFDASLVRLSLAEKFADAAALLKSAPPAAAGSAAPATEKKNWPPQPALNADPPRAATPPEPAPANSPPQVSVRAISPAPPPSTSSDSSADSPSAADAFNRFLNEAAGSRVLAHLAEKLELVHAEHNAFTLRLLDPSLRIYAQGRTDAIAAMISRYLGRPVRVSMVCEDSAGKDPSISPPPHPSIDAARLEAAMRNPLVRKAMDLLDGKIIRVEALDAAHHVADSDASMQTPDRELRSPEDSPFQAPLTDDADTLTDSLMFS